MSNRVILPTDVYPLHYDLELTPNLENLDFFCNEVIVVEVRKENVSDITLHTKEIFIESVEFKTESDSQSNPSVVEINYNIKYNTVKFVFDNSLPIGNAKITIKYRGILNGDMAGFYKSTYADANGVKKTMASTQFEALDARRLITYYLE